MSRTIRIVAAAWLAAWLTACTHAPPIPTVPKVNLERFMGDWYVIASIPTFVERGAHNAVESYRLDDDGSIATRYSFREGSFDAPPETYHARGFVKDKASNAVWKMQFLWPFTADYRIVYLSADYSRTIIGRNQRDYVWIMARQPAIDERDLADMLAFLATQGYDISLIERVPQRW